MLKNLPATGKHFTKLKDPRKTFSLSKWELRKDNRVRSTPKIFSAQRYQGCFLTGFILWRHRIRQHFCQKSWEMSHSTLTWLVKPFFWAQETRNQPHKQSLLSPTKSDTMDAQLMFKYGHIFASRWHMELRNEVPFSPAFLETQEKENKKSFTNLH